MEPEQSLLQFDDDKNNDSPILTITIDKQMLRDFSEGLEAGMMRLLMICVIVAIIAIAIILVVGITSGEL